MMGILKMVPPASGICPGPLGCIPPLYWTVGVGTIWQCDLCGRVWERGGQGKITWAEVTNHEVGGRDG